MKTTLLTSPFKRCHFYFCMTTLHSCLVMITLYNNCTASQPTTIIIAYYTQNLILRNKASSSPHHSLLIERAQDRSVIESIAYAVTGLAAH